MAIFTEHNRHRLDFWAIVTGGGVAVIDETQRPPCLEWLERNRYQVHTLDCHVGLTEAVMELHRMLDWEGQFGYTPAPDRRNLNALRDGFRFEPPEDGGAVLELIGAERVWREDAYWFMGLLDIAQEHSREHLAFGRRFFLLLPLLQGSQLIGAEMEQNRIPGLFWTPDRQRHEFRD